MPVFSARQYMHYERTKEESKWYKIEGRGRQTCYYGSDPFAPADRLDPRVIRLMSERFRHALFRVRRRISRDPQRHPSLESISDLRDDWDDEGAEGYAISTWQRAADFTAAQARRS